jgi:hypothetical protein
MAHLHPAPKCDIGNQVYNASCLAFPGAPIDCTLEGNVATCTHSGGEAAGACNHPQHLHNGECGTS